PGLLMGNFRWVSGQQKSSMLGHPLQERTNAHGVRPHVAETYARVGPNVYTRPAVAWTDSDDDVVLKAEERRLRGCLQAPSGSIVSVDLPVHLAGHPAGLVQRLSRRQR